MPSAAAVTAAMASPAETCGLPKSFVQSDIGSLSAPAAALQLFLDYSAKTSSHWLSIEHLPDSSSVGADLL